MSRKTVEERGWLGDKKIVTYENGKKICESREVRNAFGGTSIKTYDTSGKLISETHKGSGIFKDSYRTDHADGSTSRTYKSNWPGFSEKYSVSEGRVVSSSYKSDNFGGRVLTDNKGKVHADALASYFEKEKTEGKSAPGNQNKPSSNQNQRRVSPGKESFNRGVSPGGGGGGSYYAGSSSVPLSDLRNSGPSPEDIKRQKKIDRRISKLSRMSKCNLELRLLEKNEYTEVKIEILKRLGFTNLTFPALHDENPEVRYETLKRSCAVSIKDYVYLATNDKSPKIRAYAMKHLPSFEESIFRNNIIALFHDKEAVITALGKLKDECFEVKWAAEKHPDKEVRLTALELIKTKEVLISLFLEESEIEVRKAILKKLDESSLFELAENWDRTVRKMVREEIKNSRYYGKYMQKYHPFLWRLAGRLVEFISKTA